MKQSEVLRSRQFRVGLYILIIFITAIIVAQISINIRFPEQARRKAITEYFINNYGKAIKYGESRINVFGDIYITDLEVASTSDFNDNYSLIVAKSARLKLSVLSIWKKNIKFREADFSDYVITLQKDYGTAFTDYINRIFLPIKSDGENTARGSNVNITFTNGIFNYNEIFSQEVQKFVIKDLNLKIALSRTYVDYHLKGSILPCKKNVKFIDGNIQLKGKIYDNGISSHDIKITDLDVTYLNNYIIKNSSKPCMLDGTLSAETRLDIVNKNLGIDANISLNNLDVFNNYSNDEKEKELLLKKQDFTITLICDLKPVNKSIKVYDFTVKNNDIKLESVGVIRNDSFGFASLNWNIPLLNISDVNNYFYPFDKLSYGGKIKSSGQIYRNNSTGIILCDTATVSIDEGELISRQDKKSLFDKVSAAFSLNNKNLKFNITGKYKGSDLVVSNESIINSWNPYSSDSKVSVKLGDISFGDVIGKVSNLVLNIWNSAVADQAIGYNEIYFRQKPVGKFINNNNVELNLAIDNIKFNNQSAIKGFNLNIDLFKGVLLTNNFTASGFGANYNFQFTGMFNQDYPSIKTELGINDFDLAEFSKFNAKAKDLQGKLSLAGHYEFTGYRLYQILENSRGEFNVSTSGLCINNTEYQNDFQSFLDKIKLNKADIKNINDASLSVNYSMAANNINIRNLSFVSANFRLNGYGKYLPGVGLQLPVTASFNLLTDNPEIKKPVSDLPFVIQGRLLEPALTPKGNKEKLEFPLFHIN